MIKLLKSVTFKAVFSCPKSEEIAASDLLERAVMVASVLYYLTVVGLHTLHHALNILFLSSMHVGSCFLIQLVQLFHPILLKSWIGRTWRNALHSLFATEDIIWIVAFAHSCISRRLDHSQLHRGNLSPAIDSHLYHISLIHFSHLIWLRLSTIFYWELTQWARSMSNARQCRMLGILLDEFLLFYQHFREILMRLLEPLLLVRYHILVVVLDMILSSLHIWASIDYFDQQTLILYVNPLGLFLLDCKSRRPMIEFLRLNLFFREWRSLVLDFEEAVEKNLVLAFNLNASLHLFVKVGLISALCELHELTILLLIFADREAFQSGWFVTRIVPPLFIHNSLHCSLVSVISPNPLNWSMYVIVYILRVDTAETLTNWERANHAGGVIGFAFAALDRLSVSTFESCMSRQYASRYRRRLILWELFD